MRRWTYRAITFTFLLTALAVAGYYTATLLLERMHVERLFDESPLVRGAAARWLAARARHERVPDLLRAIEARAAESAVKFEPTDEDLRAAASELARPRHLPLFVPLLEDEGLRDWSYRVLECFVPLPDSTLPALGELLAHEDDEIFALAASLLARTGQRAVPALVRAVDYSSDGEPRRHQLLEVMRATLGPIARAAVPALRGKLEAARKERVFDGFEEEVAFAVDEGFLLATLDDTVAGGEFLEYAREGIECQLAKLPSRKLPSRTTAGAGSGEVSDDGIDDEDDEASSPIWSIHAALDAVYPHHASASGLGPLLLKLARLRDDRLVDSVVTIACRAELPEDTRTDILIEALRTPGVDFYNTFENVLKVCRGSSRSVRRVASWIAPLLDHHDPVLREAAASTLRDLGPGAHTSLEALQERLEELESPLLASVALATALCRAGDGDFARRLAAFLDDPPEGEPSDELVFAISRFAEHREVLRPALLRELERDDEGRRILPACALLRWYPEDPAPLEALRAALGNPSRSELAVVFMARFGVRDPRLLPDLAAVAERHPDPTCRLLAALGGPALPVLLRTAESADFDTHVEAIQALTDLQLDPGWIPALRRRLRDGDGDREYRALAIHLLGSLGPAAAAAEPELLEALDDRDFKVQRIAIRVLGELGPAVRDAPDSLSKYLTDPAFRDLSGTAMQALRKMGKAALPALKTALDSADGRARIDVAGVLAGIEDPGQHGLKALIRMLGDPAPDLRYEAAYSLIWLDGPIDAAIPALLDSLADPDEDVRREVIEALVRRPRASPRYFDTLIRAVRNRVEGATLIPLAGMGMAAVRPLLDALDGAVVAGDDDLGSWIAFTLGRIGPEARDAIPSLTALLSSDDWVTRTCAAQALGRIGPAARDATPELLKCLEDPVEDARRFVAVALARIEGRTPIRARDSRTFAPGVRICGSSDYESFHDEFCSRPR